LLLVSKTAAEGLVVLGRLMQPLLLECVERLGAYLICCVNIAFEFSVTIPCSSAAQRSAAAAHFISAKSPFYCFRLIIKLGLSSFFGACKQG
jgi:hypothetical protein